MIGPRSVHPDELGDADGMEIQDAIRVSNRLIEGIDDLSIGSSDDFADRVMAALAEEPTPGATGFLVPLRRRGFPAGLIASVRQAWVSVRPGRPMLGRSAALAYVLAVVVAGASLTGVVTLGAAGALGLFNAAPTQSPAPAVPEPSIAPTAPQPTIAPPTERPEASEPPAVPTPSPTETENEPEGSDDHGGNSGPGGGGSDDSGPGSDDDSSGSGGKSGSDDNSGPGSTDSGSDDSGSGSGGTDDSGRR
jgi:uncharacterized membrane protein YgcG